jgi:hypothetical protein
MGLAELDAVDVAERGLLAAIAKECQTPVAESGEEEQ